MDAQIWTEKYRPQNFDEIKGQIPIVEKTRAFVKEQNMPHILFSGPAGVGKTTLSLVLAKEMFKDLWRENFLELNASDERGIDVIRSKVKDFARTKALGNVPFKIIYLDECDALTREAQQALRRTMENYTTTCRFILSCNYSSKIIDPIQSRCSVFKFKPLSKEEIFSIVDKIAKNENFTLDDKAKDALFEASKGDCRRVENILQSASSMAKVITEETIFDVASIAKPKEINDVLEIAIKGDFVEAKSKLLSTMLNYGLSGIDVVSQIQKEIWNIPNLSDKIKLKMVSFCGDCEFRLIEGSDDLIQLEALLAKFVIAAKAN